MSCKNSESRSYSVVQLYQGGLTMLPMKVTWVRGDVGTMLELCHWWQYHCCPALLTWDQGVPTTWGGTQEETYRSRLHALSCWIKEGTRGQVLIGNMVSTWRRVLLWWDYMTDDSLSWSLVGGDMCIQPRWSANKVRSVQEWGNRERSWWKSEVTQEQE